MAEIKESRDFKGIWVPKEIWLNKNLTLQEKVFLCEIDSLDNEDGCYASNLYFSKFFGLTKARCSQIINNLQEKGLIDITYTYKSNTKEVEKRIIKIRIKYSYYPIKNIKEGGKYIKGTYLENAKDNNTLSNNTFNKDIDSPSDDEPVDPKIDKYQTVVDLYKNTCTNLAKVAKLTNKRRTAINKLLKEMSIEEIEKAFKLINCSEFCKGVNERGWKADFDFCIRPDKLTNALEGKYSGTVKNSSQNKTQQSRYL